MSYTATITYDNAASLSFNTSLVEVASGTVRLKDLGGGTYTTSGPIVASQLRWPVSALSTFAQSATTPSNTSVLYQVVVGTTAYYWNASSALWEEAEGNFNTAAEVNTNGPTLLTDLELFTPQYVGFKIKLLTTNASNRPALTSNTLGFTWVNQNPVVIQECLITANLTDLLGASIVPDSDRPTKLLVTAAQSFLHGSRFVLPFTKEAIFDENGYAEISIIETVTPGIELEFGFSYFDGRSVQTNRLFNAFVPDQPTATINELTTVAPYSFG